MSHKFRLGDRVKHPGGGGIPVGFLGTIVSVAPLRVLFDEVLLPFARWPETNTVGWAFPEKLLRYIGRRVKPLERDANGLFRPFPPDYTGRW